MPADQHAERVAGEVRAILARKRKRVKFVQATLGLSYPSVSRRLRGEVPFDVVELAKLAAALDVPMSTLLPPEPVEASA